jgi:hypothetical protein
MKKLLILLIIFCCACKQNKIIIDKIYQPPDKYFIKLNDNRTLLIDRNEWKNYGVGEYYID